MSRSSHNQVVVFRFFNSSRCLIGQAEAIAGVASASSLYFSFGNWVNPWNNKNLLMVVFQEGIILGVWGFVPGFIGSLGIYTLLGYVTRIPLPMRFGVAFQVFIITILMCLVSAAIAMSQLQSAEPADVF